MNPYLHFVWAPTKKRAIDRAVQYFAELPEPVVRDELEAIPVGVTQPGNYRDEAYKINKSEQTGHEREQYNLTDDVVKQGVVEVTMYKWKVKPTWMSTTSGTKIVQERDEEGRIKLRYA